MAKQRNPKSLIWKAIENSSRPAYLLDEAMALRFANEAFWQRVPATARQLLNRVLPRGIEQTAGMENGSLASGLLPPPDLVHQDVAEFTVVLAGSDDAAQASNSGAHSNRTDWIATSIRLSEGDSCCYLITLRAGKVEDQRRIPEARQLHQKWLEARRRFLTPTTPLCLLGESAIAETLRQQVGSAQKTLVNLAIVAPAGSGEEDLARFIHQGRPAALRGPLVGLECTLLDAELLQTTLRELVRTSQDEGAGRGCLLLLNVDRLVESGQNELLNLLCFPQVLFTMMVTSQVPLLKLAEQGGFLEDLARRLSIVTVELPSLSQRGHDLPEILHAQLQEVNERRVEPVSGFSDDALQRLVRYGWPRNFEQLQEVVEIATLSANGPWVEIGDLPRTLRRDIEQPDQLPWELESMNLEAFLADVETMVIRRALEQCHGNKTKAAQLLGMTRATFHRKVDAIEANGFKKGGGNES